ncbi:MAG TPA: hypothetical protein VH500_04995 [Nitrososphaeraceae archaeon]
MHDTTPSRYLPYDYRLCSGVDGPYGTNIGKPSGNSSQQADD